MASDKKKTKSVTVLRSDSDFGGSPDKISGGKSKKKKKKQSLGMVEKPIFNLAKQVDKVTTTYRDSHENSNSKKRDGWIKDLPKNTTKALGKFKVPFSL